MKITVASDLHLEFGDLDFENSEQADVLILSGDILVARDLLDRDSHNIFDSNNRSNRFHGFMQRCCERFANVIYILGNHEHYHGDYAKTAQHLKDKFGYLANLHILDNEILELDDVTFIGGTLWTDMNKRDPLTLYHMKTMMNDFRCVHHSGREVSFRDNQGQFRQRQAIFSPDDAADIHDAFVQYISVVTQGQWGKKFVVVGHHAPSRQSTHPRYAHDYLMNGGYSSELSDFILDHPQIKLWTHGHTHDSFDYKVGSTRVICNPRGYIGYEDCAETWKPVSVDI